MAQTRSTVPSDLPQPVIESNAGATNSTGTTSLLSSALYESAVEPPTPEPAQIPVAPVAHLDQFAGHVVNPGFAILAALLAFASLGGFVLYYCGLTRAKNTAHTSTLLLVGALFGLTGYWIGGFAVQTGGIGDEHAALVQPVLPEEKATLDHELGFTGSGHHWGVMGSSGFFLATDASTPEVIALLFLVQAGALVIVVTAALGAGLERGRLLPMACCGFLIGVIAYPLLANWIWGGGWLAQLGRELGLGHGVVDLAGAGVVHESAGVLALVIAVTLGPRHGRFRRNRVGQIPGHNVPFIVLGSVVLLVSWIASNAFAASSLSAISTSPVPTSFVGLAAVNTLLAATGGLVVSIAQATWQRQATEPARLCRGMLGGAIAGSGCAGLIDPWAAFLIGGVAAVLVQAAIVQLEKRRIDDPVGAASIHGVGGAWGLLAVGLFARGTAGVDLNGISAPVSGLIFGGDWHQLAAQIIGVLTTFLVVYFLGFASLTLVQKILGNRASLTDEATGLDEPETGALGYQGDFEPEDR